MLGPTDLKKIAGRPSGPPEPLILTYLLEKFEKNYNGAYGKNQTILKTVVTLAVYKIEL